MKAKDVMTHCLVSIAPEASISDAIARMISHQVSGMPVVAADGTLVGIVTEGDFLRRAEMHTKRLGGDGSSFCSDRVRMQPSTLAATVTPSGT